MDKQVEIRGELGGRVLLTVRGYERQSAQSADDANWLQCSAKVEVGRFHGEVDAAFTTHDFSRFSTEIGGVLSGSATTAVFRTIEEMLTVSIEVGRTGSASVSGELRELDGGVSLSFKFESDLSFLQPVRVQLVEIVRTFPSR